MTWLSYRTYGSNASTVVARVQVRKEPCFIEDHLGTDTEELEACVKDQVEFTLIARLMIQDMGLTDEWGKEDGDPDADDYDQDPEESESGASEEAGGQDAEGDVEMTDAVEGDVPADIDSMEMGEAEGEED